MAPGRRITRSTAHSQQVEPVIDPPAPPTQVIRTTRSTLENQQVCHITRSRMQSERPRTTTQSNAESEHPHSSTQSTLQGEQVNVTHLDIENDNQSSQVQSGKFHVFHVHVFCKFLFLFINNIFFCRTNIFLQATWTYLRLDNYIYG